MCFRVGAWLLSLCKGVEVWEMEVVVRGECGIVLPLQRICCMQRSLTLFWTSQVCREEMVRLRETGLGQLVGGLVETILGMARASARAYVHLPDAFTPLFLVCYSLFFSCFF